MDFGEKKNGALAEYPKKINSNSFNVTEISGVHHVFDTTFSRDFSLAERYGNSLKLLKV